MQPKHNKFINMLTLGIFHFDFKKQPYSDKTLNCIINSRDNYADVLRYIDKMREITRNELRMENEIIKGDMLLRSGF